MTTPQLFSSGHLMATSWSPLLKRDIIPLFEELLGLKIADFFQRHNDLSDAQKAILSHLRHVYQDSMQTVSVYAGTLIEAYNYIRKPPTLITYNDLEDYISYLKRRNQKPATINSKVACLKSHFGFFHGLGVLPNNPAFALKKTRGSRNQHSKRRLTHEEINLLLEYAKTCDRTYQLRDYLIVKTLFLTGLRAVELVSLTWNQLATNITGDWYFLDVLGKGSKVRDVYCPKNLTQDLMGYRAAEFGVPPFSPAPLLEEFPIFPRGTAVKKPLSTRTIGLIIEEISKDALGQKISPHWLRHSFATHARLKGARVEDLSAQLGHSNASVTAVYNHSADFSPAAGKVFDENK